MNASSLFIKCSKLFNNSLCLFLHLNSILNFPILSFSIEISNTMIASRTATRVAARTARAPLRSRARQIRFASTSEKAEGGISSGLVGGLTGGALVFAVRQLLNSLHSHPAHSPTSSIHSHPHLTGRIRLLLLLGRQKRRKRCVANQKAIRKRHEKAPGIRPGTQRSAQMASLHGNLLRSVHPRRKGLRGCRIQRPRNRAEKTRWRS